MGPLNDHHMDFTTQDGLLDLLTLGNTISISHILDPNNDLEPGMRRRAEAERRCVHADFLIFQNDFSKKFFLVVNGKKMTPKEGLFDPLLLQFLVQLMKYKQEMHNIFDSRFTSTQLYDKILAHLHHYHLDIVPAFIQKTKKGASSSPCSSFFQWGGQFSIVRGSIDKEMEGINSAQDVEMNGM
jgi:hypothetical protein